MTRTQIIEQAIRDWFKSRDGFVPATLAAFIETRIMEEEQRRSFAFGNANISNPAVTREMVNEVADIEKRPHKFMEGGIGCKACGLGPGAYVHNGEAIRLARLVEKK